jgi:hypothetical protein
MGGFFMLGGDVHRKVDVVGNPPPSGESWVHKLTTPTVTSLPDTAPIEARTGTVVEWILKN